MAARVAARVASRRHDNHIAMKHAGPSTLHSLETLLAGLRALPGLVEKRPGIFYLKSRAYLHFHEDPAGVFADVRWGGNAFERFPVNTGPERELLLGRVRADRSA